MKSADTAQSADAASPEGTAPQKGRVCPKCGQRYLDDALFCPADGAPLASPRRSASSEHADTYLGVEISGHIRIQSLAGVERDVAVKILHRELSANQQLVQRFHREAKVASRLAHPNVVHVHLAGQLPDGALYMVMEYLDGLSLQSALAAAGGAMELPRALHVALQICDAVGEAHAQGVVHRDLKPENVMLVRRGGDEDFVKVLDFGIARINWGEQSMATAAGLIFGTARYISPEGAQGETVTPPSDVYSIATLLYQMLAGRTPFEGDQAVALLVQQIHDPPPALRSIPRSSYVPDAIAETVMRNLGKNPAARDEDARAFGRSLLDAAKAAGLAIDDLALRPLLSSRPSGAVQLAPMQRTKQLQLDSGTQERLAALSSDAAGTPAAPAPERTPSRPPAQGSGGSAVDVTLDDVEQPPAPPPAAPSLHKTEMSAPLDVVLPPPTAPRPVAPSMPEAEEPPPALPRRRFRVRAAAVFALCFVLGVGGAIAVAYRLGYVGPSAETASQRAEAARVAMRAHHFDAPPGDNVLDLTDDGLTRWPDDPGLLDVRRVASDEVTKQAVAEWTFGVKAEGLRLMRLAARLDPSDEAVRKLVASYAAELGDAGAFAAQMGDAGLPALRTSSAPTAFAPNVAHAAFEFAPPTPRMGSPVQLVTRYGVGPGRAKAPAEGAIYEIAGPGVQGVIRLPPACDAQECKAQFTFLEPGRFAVSFSAKVDGQVVKVARAIPVGDGSGKVPPSGSEVLPPLPSATGKWM